MEIDSKHNSKDQKLIYPILVVEDDRELRRFILKLLEQRGFDTLEAGTGKAAIELATQHPECLMLIDYKLPDYTANEIMQELIEQKATIPFVAMTGFGSQKIAVEMMKLRANDFLVKDSNFFDLMPTVMSKLHREVAIEKKLASSEEKLKFRYRFENIIIGLSVNFINLPINQIDDGIEKAIKKIGEFCESSRCFVLLFDENKKVEIPFEWCAKGVKSQKHLFKEFVIDENFKFFTEKLKNKELLYVPDIRELPESASLEYELLNKMGKHSLILVPFIKDGKIYGALGMDNIEYGHTFSLDFISLLEVASEMILNVLIRKEDSIRIEKSEFKYNLLAETAGDIILVIDRHGKFKFVNNTALEISGYSLEETKALTIFDVVPEDKHEILLELSRKNFSGRTKTNIFEIEIISKSGMHIPTEVCASPIKLGDVVTDVMVVARDIRIRKSAIKALVESEKKYHGLYSSMNEGVALYEMLYDQNGEAYNYRIIDVNKSYERIMGIEAIDAIGKKADEIYKLDQLEHLPKFLRVVETGEPESFEVFLNNWNRYYNISAFATGKNKFAIVFNDVTDQKLAQKIISDSEEKFRAIVEQSADGILVFNSAGRIIEYNKSIQSITGLSKSDVMEMFIWEFEQLLINKDNILPDINEVKKRILETVEHGQNSIIEGEIYRQDGQIRIVQRIVFSFETSEGKMVCIIVRDVTERNRMMQEIITAKNQWEKTFETVPDLVTIVNSNYEITKLNQSLEKLFKLKNKDIVNRNFFEFFEWEDYDIFTFTGSDDIFSGKIMEIHDRNLNKYFLVSTTEIIETDDAYYVMVARDISQLKRTELAKETISQVSEILLTSISIETAFQLIPDILKQQFDFSICGIELLDPETGRISIVGSLNDKETDGLIPIDGFNVEDSIFRKVFESGDSLFVSNVQQKTDFDARFVRAFDINTIVAVPIKSKGQLIGVIGLADTSERKEISLQLDTLTIIANILAQEIDRRKAEKEVLDINKDLELRVLERTTQLEETLDQLKAEILVRRSTEDKILLAKQELERAFEQEKQLNELKTRFISMISHEYRTPLTVILTSTFILEKLSVELKSDDFSAYIEKIQASVKSMTQLLEDVLFIGKMEADNIKLQLSKVSIEKICDEVIDEIRLVDNREHEIDFHYESDVKQFTTDNKLLRQIITNLLSNACKYSPINSEIRFTMSIKDNVLRFIISDQGIGISEDDNEHIFSAFHRGKNIGVVQGTGLGLAIVKRSVEALNGEIILDTELGRGTQFAINIPGPIPRD
jgi:PAS domain S-box-containing protein